MNISEGLRSKAKLRKTSGNGKIRLKNTIMI